MLAQAMTTVLFSWFLLGVCFLGLGLLVRRSMGVGEFLSPVECLASFWVGWAVTIFFLQVWQLVLPLAWAFPLLLLPAIGGLVWSGGALIVVSAGFVRNHWLLVMVLSSVGIWLSNLAVGAPFYYDTGLYHMPMMRWLATFRLVPGLGNLHGRFAFNNSSLLYAAMLEAGFWPGRSHNIANGLLLWAVWAQVLGGMWAILRMSASRVSAHHIFSALWLAAVLNECANSDVGQFVKITSLSPDVPVFALGAFLGMYLLRFILSSDLQGERAGWVLFVICAVASVGITVKLSFLVMGLASVAVAAGYWWGRSGGMARHSRWRAAAWAFGMCLALGVPWVVRGVVLSGYPVYPSTFGGIPVEWRIPRERVIAQRRGDMAWARQPKVDVETVLASWNWLGPWFESMRYRVLWVRVPVTLGLAAFVFVLLGFVVRAAGGDFHAPSHAWFFMLIPGLALVFWFFTAPDARFAIPVTWAFGAGAVALAVIEVRRWVGYGGGAFAALLLGLFVALYFFPGVMGNPWGVAWNAAGPENGFYRKPRVPLRMFRTDSGLVVNVPVQGDQCYDGPLPCAPEADPKLRLRREGDLRGGFAVAR